MTSATGRSKSGFTLLEIIVTIAIMAMVSGLVIASFGNLVFALQEKPIDRIFREMVREARIQSATNKEVVYLSYDRKRGEFLLTQRSGEKLDEYLESDTVEDDEWEVLFYPKISHPSGRSVSESNVYSEQEIPQITFHPSGSSTPVQVLFRFGYDEQRITLDAFSSGSEMKRNQPNAF